MKIEYEYQYLGSKKWAKGICEVVVFKLTVSGSSFLEKRWADDNFIFFQGKKCIFRVKNTPQNQKYLSILVVVS